MLGRTRILSDDDDCVLARFDLPMSASDLCVEQGHSRKMCELQHRLVGPCRDEYSARYHHRSIADSRTLDASAQPKKTSGLVCHVWRGIYVSLLPHTYSVLEFHP